MTERPPSPLPLGATTGTDGTTFVVSSGVAEAIDVCLFDRRGVEADRIPLEPGTGTEWSVAVGGVVAGQRYGYRVHGPRDRARGHGCDPSKLLVDPAARRLEGELRWSCELLAPGIDSAPFVPRSLVVEPAGPPPEVVRRPWAETVVYEAHVGHLTARHRHVPPAHRGRYLGLCAPAVLEHLQDLGVTALELLPVQHFVSEADLVARGERNVWGYNPLGWSAPHAAYASDGGDPVAELRAAVAALHGIGVEVWLDVVFNHTCEGSLAAGPVLSLRGFDNADAYRLRPGPASGRPSVAVVDDDVTGCGNAIDVRSPWIRRLIVESLHRWVGELGIDGFRFDLAATLVRGDDGPVPGASPLLGELAAEPALEGVRLIAEPWDVGPGGYALGRFAPPWREWNDRFRDDVRDLWRGERPAWSAFATRLAGSPDVLRADVPDRSSGASRGVNAVATHDGRTVADLVDGDGPMSSELRGRRQRCLLGTAIVSQGIPMVGSGDELGRSQGGEVDGYTLEPGTWGLDWDGGDEDLAAWVSEAISLRRRHPALRRERWVGPGDPEIGWFTADGTACTDHDWHAGDRVGLQALLASPTPGDASVLLLFAPVAPVVFRLPAGPWWSVLDSASPRGASASDEGAFDVGASYEIGPAGLVVLLDRPDGR